MSCYVDQLRKTKTSKSWPYPKACHLIADSVAELHSFAKMLGLKPSWFQNHERHPHYILTESKRNLAVRKGVLEVKFYGEEL